MEEIRCVKINQMLGWGCCKCRSYNGDQRVECKFCPHRRCDARDGDKVEQEVHAFLEALADWYFTQRKRHPVRGAITYRHTLRALGESDALRVELGAPSVLVPGPSNGNGGSYRRG